MNESKKEKVLVVVAHADDEAIGCGGSLLKHATKGDTVRVIYMTNGVGARGEDDSAIADRLIAQKDACNALNIDKFYNFDFPDNAMDTVSLISVVQSIEPILNDYKPTLIYTHHGGDLNIDHRVVHQAVLTSCRPQPESSVKTILSFEVNSSTEWSSTNIGSAFTPNYFEDISNFQAQKQTLLKIYGQEMKPFPHTRSIRAIEALNCVRGTSVGVESAEAFMLLRALR